MKTVPPIVPVSDLVIDRQLLELAGLPPLTDGVRDALKARIELEGPAEPLVIWGEKNVVIDGVARLRIYRELAIKDCPVFAKELATDRDAVVERVSRNAERRHLSHFSACCIGLNLFVPQETKIGADGKRRKRKNGQGDAWQDAADLASKLLHRPVGKRSLHQSAFICEHLDERYTPELAAKTRRQLENGEEKVSNVARALKSWTSKSYADPNRRRHGDTTDKLDDQGKATTLRNSHEREKKKTDHTDEGPVVSLRTLSATPAPHFAPNTIQHADWYDLIDSIPDAAAAMYLFSSPYLGGSWTYGDNFNDKATYDKFIEWLHQGIQRIPRTLMDGGMVCMNIDSMTTRKDERSDDYRQQIYKDAIALLDDAGLNFYCDIVWDKGHAAGRPTATGFPGALRIKRSHEYVLLASKSEPFLINNTNAQLDFDPYSKEASQWLRSTVWPISPDTLMKRQQRPDLPLHPCSFPVELCRRLICMFSFQDQLVVDPFLGSGTSAVTAKALKRQFYGGDINAEYIRLAEWRLENRVPEIKPPL